MHISIRSLKTHGHPSEDPRGNMTHRWKLNSLHQAIAFTLLGVLCHSISAKHDGKLVSQYDTHTIGTSVEELFSSRSTRLRRQVNSGASFPVLPNITHDDVRFAISRALEIVSHRFDYFQPQIYNAGASHKPNSSAWFMSVSHKANTAANNVSRISLLSEEATHILAQKYVLNREQIAYSLPNLDIRNSVLNEMCPQTINFPCQPRKYRAYNGYCNNVQHPRWGSANMRYLRYLMPDYADGVSSPRRGKGGEQLPSSRLVSLAIHKDSDRPHEHLMALTAVWGEFISHDIAHTPQMAGYDGSPIKCCNVAFENFHPDCYPIRISENDPYYGKVRDVCQEYVRSSVAPRIGCTLGPREQINMASSYLDASHIYGTTKKRVEELRLFQGGLMRVQSGPSGELLPSDGTSMYCKSTSGDFRCFKAGDERVNEHIGLTAMHTLWMREHNRVARHLGRENPHWSDEVLFQEARRIIIAEIQHITYHEYLPVILGQSVVSDYGLSTETFGFHNGYDININVGVLNAVASAALWFFASLMPKTMPTYDSNWRKLGESSISDSFYSPFDLYRNGMLDQIFRGFLRGKAQSEDQFINDVMTNHMFETDPFRGLDLAAQLIQQGRDHGLRSYVHFRQLCGLGEVKAFSDLNGTMELEVIEEFESLYSSVEDIDLFSGALSEYAQEGAVVGPTFACLLGIQFKKLKNGDRFWYENDLPPSSFTLEQLQQIRKVTLARVICDNSNGIDEVQPNVFLGKDPFLNSPMHCEGDAIHRIDFSKWHADENEKNIPSTKVLDAIKKARSDISRLRTRELDLWKDHKNADPQSPVGTAFGLNKPKPQALEIANTSFLLQFATVRFLNGILGHSDDLQDSEHSHPVTRDVRDVLSSLPTIEISALTDLPKNERCGEHDLPCDHTSIFRSITGWCNNLKFPGRGKAFTAFKRLLPPEYGDGLQTPRSLSIQGTELPSARVVSYEVHDDISVPHQRYSLLLMQYAQLLDHDLTHTPMNRGFGGSILDCHRCDSRTQTHPECWPITIADGDPYFPKVNATTGLPFCLHFVRSLPGQLTLGAREQLNQVTSYVDASSVYGSDVCEATKLRTFIGGRLNVTKHPGGHQYKDLLPQTPDHPECKAPSGLCFEAGDLRSSEQPALAALHTIWLREHNRLVDELHQKNPHWDDELLYQHTRRILSAVTQHITYGEFLPRILGWDATHKYELELLPEGYFHGYDGKCDASIYNEFATAAFRFGHSLLKPAFRRFASDLRVREPSVQLRHTFFDPDLLFQVGMIDELLYGLANTPMETLDNFITEEVTNHLFEEKKAPLSGMDLAALNIQRARDHGIPGYNEYRVFCNLTRARSFDDLKREIPPRLIQKLKKIYASVDDIDLFPGGLAETPLKGGLVGPTFGCIIGKQFQLLKKCDRFWYENAEPLTRFTSSQLQSIRKTSLAKVICENSDSIQLIQRSALDLPEPFLNPRVHCDALPWVDVELWRDRIQCEMNGKNITLGAAVRVSPCVMCICSKEGPICQSMKVDNCIRLSRSFKSSEILKDDVCKVQCAFAFRLFPPSSIEVNNSI